MRTFPEASRSSRIERAQEDVLTDCPYFTLGPILPIVHYSHNDVSDCARCCHELGASSGSYFRRIPCSTTYTRSWSLPGPDPLRAQLIVSSGHHRPSPGNCRGWRLNWVLSYSTAQRSRRA